jgi:hypothetical protein
MGSGRPPSAGWGYAAYQHSIRYQERGTGTWKLPSLSYYRSQSTCWNIAQASSDSFYFGGAGFNGTTCGLD